MRQIVALLVTILLCPSTAFAESGFFPPEVKGETWIDLGKYDEPPFLDEGAVRGFRTRYRFSVTGIMCTEYVIRIDERKNGTVKGTLAKGSRCPRDGFSYTVESFRVREDQMQDLKDAIAEAKLWELFPEFWGRPDDICVDGEQLNFERLDGTGYRISLANAQCGAPRNLLKVAEQFLLLAHQRDALRLLR